MLNREELVELYINQRLTSKEIADKTGFAKPTIDAHLSKHKISKRKIIGDGWCKTSTDQISDEQIISYFNDGKNATEIATTLSVHPCTIQRRYKKLGLKIELIKIKSNFENLTVIEDLGELKFKSKIDRVYLCQCSCGNTKKCRRSRLLDGRNTSCGCIKNLYPRKQKEGLFISSYLWQRLKTNAKKRRLEFTITKDYILELWTLQNGKCALTNMDMKLPIRQLDSNSKNLGSLDRIDSSKGYIEGNLRWILWPINRMKWDMSDIELINWCKLLLDNQ